MLIDGNPVNTGKLRRCTSNFEYARVFKEGVNNAKSPSDTLLEVSIVGPRESWGTIGGDAQDF